MNARRNAAALVAGMVLALVAGCGSGSENDKLASVYGTVTLDGEPLEGATVMFVPQYGAPSTGMTDDYGEYTLSYSAEEDGAEIGIHRVRISTYREDFRTASGNFIPGMKELLSREYINGAALSATVKPGTNVFDFPLSSMGDPTAPSAPPGGGRLSQRAAGS